MAQQADSNPFIQKCHDVNSDKEVRHYVSKSKLNYWLKILQTFRRQLRNSAYPAHVESLWILIAVVAGLHFSGKNASFGLMGFLSGFRVVADATVGWQLAICCVVAFIYWTIICRFLRYTLKILLMYKGYMHETRGKGVSLKTKIWAMLLKGFQKWNPPSLYSFQESLPRLPVPKLDETLWRYLRSIQPLFTENEYKEIAAQAEEFKNGIGKKLQRYLVLKSWWAQNYVSDWWEEYIYLRSRSSLMINSNYYVSDYFERKTKSQSARAANLIHLIFRIREKFDLEEIKPVMGQGIVPLCSQQYKRVFNTFREAGIESDKIVHFDEAEHVAVLHRGSFYKLIVYHQGKLLKPIELQHQIEQILSGNLATTNGERNLASLTAWNRTKWAETRSEYFSRGVNKESLHAIESAAFFMSFDDEPFGLSFNCSQENLDNQAKKILHGNGNNRWFDKSLTIIVTSDAQIGLNIEHSWGDGPVLGHTFEEIMIEDFFSYDKCGNLKGTMNLTLPPPKRLVWDFSNSELTKIIEEAYGNALKIIDENDHRVILHKTFGKGFIKTCNVSPDAYIQMALQLANYREFGKFTLTYEASMTRLFLGGRTETVRSCTIESSAWVKAMESKSSSTSEKVRLLHIACKRHQMGYLDAMCGRGVDRHLFCLYVVSKYLEIDSPFLQQAVSEPWRLSTSQTPHGQISKLDFEKIPGILSPGAGFGPVAHDGYSVSYIVSGEHLISFHVSSNRSSPLTDSSRFIERIVQAMADMKALFEDFKLQHSSN